MWIDCLADDSHVMSSIIFSEKVRNKNRFLSALEFSLAHLGLRNKFFSGRIDPFLQGRQIIFTNCLPYSCINSPHTPSILTQYCSQKISLISHSILKKWIPIFKNPVFRSKWTDSFTHTPLYNTVHYYIVLVQHDLEMDKTKCIDH